LSTKARYSNGILRYYESDTHETSGPVAPVALYDDFLNPSLVIPAAGSEESGVLWSKKIVGAAPPTAAGVANGTNGEVKLALTADSQKQNADLYAGDQLAFSVVQGLVFEARVKVSTLPTSAAEAVWGVASAWADGPDGITYSAFFTADGSGEIFCEVDDNATDSSATSGVTVLNTQYKIYRIDFSDPTSIKFFIDGAQVAASTTFPWAASAANSKVQPYLSVYKASGTGVGDITIDYVRLFQKRA
jgi:hypothetical protein